MKILSIETSCDETSASVLEKRDEEIRVLSNITMSSASLHAQSGGIIPERAAREQLLWIIPVIVEALVASQGKRKKLASYKFSLALSILKNDIDAVAVTQGPGLIGSLLVGVETAKTLAYTLGKPIIPVHHLLAHISANFIGRKVQFPFVGLIISGGHTDLLYFKSIDSFIWLGGTRDDAAGEALDKIGRLLDLSYPAGPEIEKRARLALSSRLSFKSPLLKASDFDFSFSGLKAEVARMVEGKNLSEDMKNQVCYATQKAIFDVLIEKTIRAAKKYNVKAILLGGGVSANRTLQSKFKSHAKRLGIKIFSPKISYCTDNAAMIGAQALLDYKPVNWNRIYSKPELYF